MKRKWENFKKDWWTFWGIEEAVSEDDDDSVQHLSRADKINIWYGSFIMCMVTAGFCCLAIGICYFWVSRQNQRNAQDVVNTIATYFATATEDEYDEIARTIRHDLVFSEYGRDMENPIQYLPNTSGSCPTCQDSYPSQVFLVCVNTGELYSLDIYHADESPEEKSNSMRMTYGYDEISEAHIHINTSQGTQNGYAEIERGRRIVSAHKMKTAFCDDCIRKILDTIDGQLMEEIVLFNSGEKAFYPIKEGQTLQTENYELAVSHDDSIFKIAIEYVSE